MIHKVNGNLLHANVEALVNTVNCVGVMGKGIALQFKQAYPEVFRAYAKACEAGQVVTGQIQVCDLGSLTNPRYVINFPTKQHWKEKSKMEYIDQGLVSLVAEIKRHGIRSIALPPLGCGNGGLNWLEVLVRIEMAFQAVPEVEVWVYEPAGAPSASSMPVRTPCPKMTPGRAALMGLMTQYQDAQMDDEITLLEVHKLMYFLQELGEPLRLTYVKGQYGPYSTNLHHVLERLEGHFISGYGDGREQPGKTLTYRPEIARQAMTFLEANQPTLMRMKRMGQLIDGFETPYGMELLASVHWIACYENPQAKTEAQCAIDELCRWNERKARMFRAPHIQVAWERLKEQSWF